MHTGKLVIAQLMEHLPLTTFRRSVARYRGHHKVQRFSCLDQYLSMAFAQLTYRESLRDIETCLRAQASKLYVMDRGYIDFERLGRLNEAGSFFLYRNFEPPFFLARAISPGRWDVNRFSG